MSKRRDNSEFSVDLVAKLCSAWAKIGGLPAELALLIDKSAMLRVILRALRGGQEIGGVDPIINGDANPRTPEGWGVEKHQQSGILTWTESLVALYLTDKQKVGGSVRGYDLHEALKDQKVLNANVLDFLLEHPWLIPEEWKHKPVFFWGTIYREPGGHLCVRYLDWHNGEWYSNHFWLDDNWEGLNPAAVLNEA